MNFPGEIIDNAVTAKSEERKQLVPLSPVQEMMQIIRQVASDPNADAAKAQAFLNMQIQIMDKQAEIDFFAAKSRLKELLKDVKIVKTHTVKYDVDKNDKSKGKKDAFKFVPLEKIDDVVAPLLVEVGIADSYTMAELVNGLYKVTCRLSKGTFTEETTVPLPLDAGGGKNNVQAAGSTFSYGRRYTLCAALGLVMRGEDNDGAGSAITTDQAVELDVLISEVGMDKTRFLEKYEIADIRELRTKDHQNALNSVYAYEAQKKRREEQKAKKP